MLDKELFFSLCEKYGVEMSTTAIRPMIKDREEGHIITDDDISKIFLPYRTYFEKSSLYRTHISALECKKRSFALDNV